ncbi:EamA family transporter [Lactobacillus johnsonii]|jgi:drug/metabolite transporter (DMT)-like permease|uniref:DMT transporter permease n=2 Tax=Lactobacillus johnsonii TaxID=33959 RepID=A0A7D9N897_LACJH|nr:EamA family transporter [Lactobacillus johnsonii]MDY2639721.1 EamA family transporter [Ligilactobacillus salivarius]AAS09596.1 DMT permease [Lactobacillus johnsonii NCC 533]AHA97911.1 DMT transporter permease [Lactobacillus johnsonii N6.2]MCI6762737.1 EamA family transporter [Lactobacillus johnsonii]MCT3321873.1 EamA/RhaT family transporter [Lactobacillus johnsonii]
MDKQSKSRLWTILAALAAVMWGISGLFAESLFKVSSKITPIWLTQVRLIISGIVLLIIATVLHQKPFSVLKDKKNTLHIIAYGIFGLLPVQVFYFIAIEMANASIATILQFIGPFFVLTYLAVTHQQVLRKLDVLAAILAFIGVFLLSTHGNFNQLAITPLALFFGLLSAVGEASYTLIPVKLVKRVSSLVVTGWGMLFAGIGLMIVYPRFPAIPNTPRAWLDVSAIIIIGTIIPFQIMANALRYVKPSTVSLLDAFEPLSATVGSVLIFGLVMSGMDWLGTLLVIGAVLALNFTPKRNIKKS